MIVAQLTQPFGEVSGRLRIRLLFLRNAAHDFAEGQRDQAQPDNRLRRAASRQSFGRSMMQDAGIRIDLSRIGGQH